MRDGNALETLLSDLYLSAVDPGAASRLPSRFAALTGGVSASVWRVERQSIAPVGQMITNVPPEGLVAYREHYYRQDPWTDAVHRVRSDEVMRGSEVVDDRTLARSAFYNEYGVRFGLFHVLGLLVPLGPEHGDRVGVVSILRPRGSESFDSRATAALASVLPHLRNTFQLHEQLEGRMEALRSDALDGALDALGHPAAVLGSDGTVVRFNALIEPMIHGVLPRGRTVTGLTRSPAAAERLSRLVAAAAAGGAGGQVWLPHTARPILATVAPLPETLARLDASGRARVLLLLRVVEGGGTEQVAALAKSVFGLTQAEAHAASCLASGHSPGDIAHVKSVKVSTVRTLLGRAQDKVGARNLRDLVRILAMLR